MLKWFVRDVALSVPTDVNVEWPAISILVPVYNEETQIRSLIGNLLSLDYPLDKRQILIVSDASTDHTDAIVTEYAAHGVELLRLPERRGKTAAENAARQHLIGDVIVNTDASIRIPPDALKPLIRCFADPQIGVASGRDVSRAAFNADPNVTEASYVAQEMDLRALESRFGSIVGASGCFYAVRRTLHRADLPNHLSRDFLAALLAYEGQLRAVSVNEAVCFVPRTTSLQQEYRRKVRTISLGMRTLWFKRHLLNPLRHARFAWMLWSHKVVRWAIPCTTLGAAIGVAVLSAGSNWARAALLGSALLITIFAWLGWRWPADRAMPRILAVPAGACLLGFATIHSIVRALRRDVDSTWEPTRRTATVVNAGPRSLRSSV